MPAAIGAKLARKDRTVVALLGDGGFAMSGLELLTAVRELAQPGSKRWQEMAERAAEISRPYASLDIASECLRVAAGYRAAGQASR